MVDSVICAIANAFRIYLIRRLNIIFLCHDENKNMEKKEILAYGSFWLLNTSLYLFFHLAWVNVLCNLVGMSLLARLYTKEIKFNLFVTGAIYIVAMVCDFISVILFVDYQDGKSFTQFCQIVMDFLFFICVLLIEKIVQYRAGNYAFKSWPLIFVPLCSIVTVVLYLVKGNRANIIGAIGILIINFLMFYLYNMLLKSFSKLYEHDMLKQKVDAYSNQMSIMLESEERVKILRHDMKHHMNELKILAMKNDNKEIENYISSMEEYVQNPSEIVSTGNVEIDSVLNYMLQVAKKELNSVNVQVRITEAFNYSFDINTVIGNLLENAIEAAKQSDEKVLEGFLQAKQGILKIEFENSFSGKINKEGERFTTTKKRTAEHGIGLQSVRKIIEKYNGILDIKYDENRFGVKAILYISK